MEAALVDEPEDFLERAGAVLADEARHNLILGIVNTLIRAPEIYPERHLYLVEDGDAVVGAAVRTPPFNLIVADALDPASVAPMAALAAADAGLPGVVGNQPTVDLFVQEWEKISGREATRDMAQGVFALRRVADVESAPGSPRPAVPTDQGVVERWIHEFSEEALPTEPRDADRIHKAVARRLAEGGPDAYWIWERDGEAVSLTGHGSPTGRGIRVGPVYTPPKHRGNGYASALVAAQSQWLLDAGYEFCFLYTDLSNPTSNAIYERIGYRQIAEAAMYSFGSAT